MQPKEECKMEIRKTKTKPFFIGVEETKEKKKTFLLPFTKVYYTYYTFARSIRCHIFSPKIVLTYIQTIRLFFANIWCFSVIHPQSRCVIDSQTILIMYVN